MKNIVSLIFISLFLQSCATTDNTASNTVEGPIAIELKGTAVEVQNFIEEMILSLDKINYCLKELNKK